MDINQLLIELSETDVLVEAKLSDQERAAVEKALSITSVELAHIKVKNDWDKEYTVDRPLIRMYAPIKVKNVVITRNLDIKLNLHSERFKSFVIKDFNKEEKAKAILAILRSAKKDQLQAMAQGGEKLVSLPAQVLQIKHIESETYMYPVNIGVLAGAFQAFCEYMEIGPDDLIEKVLGD